MMSRNFEWRLQFALAQYLEAVQQLLDQAMLQQEFRRDFLFSAKFGKIHQINQRIIFLENIGKTPFGQPAMQGHLAAFESGAHARTRPRALAFCAACRSLSVPRTHAQTDALAPLV